MKTYSVEVGGTITRDIKRYEVDAESEDEVREIVARELPYYAVRNIIEHLTPDSEAIRSLKSSPSSDTETSS
jgi:hypothetical protein